MSVLFLRRRQRLELAHDWSPCDNGCVETMGRGRAVGKWEAELMGRHCAWLCDRCKEAWRLWWRGAGGGVPVVDGRRDARAFEEAA